MNSIANNWSFIGVGIISMIYRSVGAAGSVGAGLGFDIPLQLVQQQSANATDGFDALDIVYDALKEHNGLYMVHRTINVFPPGMPAPTSASHLYNFYLPSGQMIFTLSY